MDQNQNLQIARSLPRNLRLKGARTSRLRTPGAGFFSYSVPPWIRGEYVASKGKSTLTVSARSSQLTIKSPLHSSRYEKVSFTFSLVCSAVLRNNPAAGDEGAGCRRVRSRCRVLQSERHRAPHAEPDTECLPDSDVVPFDKRRRCARGVAHWAPVPLASRRGSGERRDVGKVARSESGRRPARSRGSRTDFCGG